MPASAIESEITRKRADVGKLCRKHHVRRLEVFGSATNNTFDDANSDLDFLVEFEDMPPSQFAQDFFAVKEGLEVLFGRHVDLVTDSSLANPYFFARDNAQRCSIYES